MPINLNEHNFYEERILVSKNLMGLANIQQARSVTGVVQVDKMDNPTDYLLFIRTLNLALNITRSIFGKLVAERSKFYKFCTRHNESFAFNNVIKYNGSNIKSWISTVRAAFLTCGKSHFLENEIQPDNEEYYDYQLLINFRKHARFSHRHSRSK
ncbi:hypothetical protein DERF_006572 [Dermatophagoides farinae]|uniref:Uncharacterized protein n=1 Tax=Dermatophagoides farinae TaxID=6954 RepID=A0A922I1M3_DERFA|nr:hypothetical protein DERF_006572 [Dermatophagoides farinae]